MSKATREQLPPGWIETTLREVLMPGEKTNPARNRQGEFYYIDIEAIDNKQQRVANPKRLSNAAAPSRARNKLVTDDVLFCLVRPYLKNIAVIPKELNSAVASTAFYVCRLPIGVSSRFVFNLLRRDLFIDAIPTYGSSPPAARDVEFEKQPILLPPTAEQERIADKLDELLSDLDAGVAALEQVQAKLKHYRIVVLKAAVEGALTTKWRDKNPTTEPASILLTRILTERRRRWEKTQIQKFKDAGKEPPKDWKSKYKEPATPDTTKLPALPNGWCWVRLGQLLFEIEAGKSFSCVPRRAGLDEWGIIKVSAMSWGFFDETENKTVPVSREIDPYYEIKPGDILLSRANTYELVGASVLVKSCRPHLLMSDKSMRLLHSPNLDKVWLKTILESPVVRRQLSQKSTGTKEGMRNVSQESVLDVVIPLAPAVECLAIVEAVENQLSVVDHLEADLVAKLKSAQALRQSILRHAFTGQLVPQNPKDEPAAELLKRIAAQRAKLARQKQSGKPTKGLSKKLII